MDEDQLFNECFEQAILALEEKEVAIGCIFYHTNLKKVIARSRNSTNATKNATRHAEMNCIEQVYSFCSQENVDTINIWPSIDVYVTCEPCIMCARVLRHLKVRRVLYGCSNERFGGCRSVIDVATTDKISEGPLKYIQGIREEETVNLLKTFYQGENLNAPEEIRKVKKIRFNKD